MNNVPGSSPDTLFCGMVYGKRMTRKTQKKTALPGGQKSLLSSETGTIVKNWRGRIAACIVFPNAYYVGMSSLATHMLYKRLNDLDHVVCERCFFGGDGEVLSLESARPLSRFDIVFFTLSFELDYVNIPRILMASSIHLRAEQRGNKEPLIVAGGICTMSNPEPLHDLFDLFILGDIEETLDCFMEAYIDVRPERRRKIIDELSRFDWVYNPRLLEVSYNEDGTVKNFLPREFQRTPARYHGKKLGASAVMCDETEFSRMFLIEGTRGCPSRCPFCLLGNLYHYSCDSIDPEVTAEEHLGILGGGVSFHPDIVGMVTRLKNAGKKIHLPSMRIDEIPVELIRLMNEDLKTLTFGIEAGSERLRRFLGKPFTNEEIYAKAEDILAIKPFNLKLYFMIGLFGEDMDDIDEITELTKKIGHIMVRIGAPKGFVGNITVHVSPFVPKPFTPFQWLPMDSMDSLKKKINRLQKTIGKLNNTYFTHESVKFSYLQGVFSRGDRRVDGIIHHLAAGGNLTTVTNESPINLNFYALRKRTEQEIFPWDFIVGNTAKDRLFKRLQTAMAMLD